MELNGASQSTLVSMHYDDDKKQKVAYRKVIIFFVVVVAIFVGLCVGLYFIGKSDGINEANQSTKPTAATKAPDTTTPASSALTPTPNLGYRLPRNAVPVHYRLTLYPDIYQKSPENFTFSGWEIITIKIVFTTNRIFLHAAQSLEIDFANLKLFEYLPEDEEPLQLRGDPEPTQETNITFIGHIYHTQFAYYEFVFDKTLPLGEYKLRLSWKSKLLGSPNPLNGLYYSSFTDSVGVSYMAVTQFQSTAARKAFPCFDEPEYKAVFESRLVRKSSHSSLSNAEKKLITRNVVIDRDTLFVDVFRPTVVMSSYLNAFAVHQYVPMTPGVPRGSVNLTYWHREDRESSTKYIAEVGVKMLEKFDEMYKTEYPFRKLDFFPIPDFSAGAMENWGLITYAESSYYYNPDKDPHSQKEGVAAITAHELAHMNFGNMVTAKWWDDLWLNEGFASYLEYAGLKAADEKWDTDGRFLISDVILSMRVDSLSTTRSITRPAESPSEVSSMFDSSITYSKGAAVCRMMEAFLTPAIFQKSLTSYQRVFKFKSAVSENLFDAITGTVLAEELDNIPDLNTTMQGWLTQPGHPVVSAEYSSPTTRQIRLSLSQTPFELEKGNFSTRTWHIPMTPHFSGDVGLQGLAWLSTETSTLTYATPQNWYNNGGWYVLNVRHNGYYRINYDLVNWQRVTAALLKDISTKPIDDELTRTQLIDDALYLALGGYPVMKYPLALNMATYLCHEYSYAPWRASLDGLNAVEQHFWQTEYDGKMKAFGRSIINNVYNFLGWETTNDAKTSYHYLRTSIMSRACRWELPDCINEAKKYFDLWLNEPETYLIPTDTTSTVRCYGIKAKDANTDDRWWALYTLYINSAVQSDRNNYINALGCSDDEELMKWFLDNALTNSTVRPAELLTTFQAVAANPKMHELTKNFFEENWQVFIFNSSSPRRAMEAAYQYVNTEEELKEVQQWKQEAGNLGSAESSYNNLIVTINKNIAWMTANEADVVDWLNAFDPATLPADCHPSA